MLEKIFKHELSMWIHRLNLVAALLAFLHVLLIPYVRSIAPFTVLVILYTVIAFGAYGHYAYNKYLNVKVGILKNIRKVDSNITEVTITTSKSILRKIEAGDFSFISFPNVKGMKEPHPFSILNIPERDGYVQMSIEGVGDFTKNLPKLEVEEKVNLTRGYGVLSSMIEKSGKNEKFVLIGGGIGVVPLLGLADKFDNKDITFLYTVKKDKKPLYQEKFELWNERSNFKSYSQNGRFTTEQLDKYLPVGEEYNYIIAGPMVMNLAYEKMLKGKDIKKNRIFYEGFNF
jgi:ferric reductase